MRRSGSATTVQPVDERSVARPARPAGPRGQRMRQTGVESHGVLVRTPWSREASAHRARPAMRHPKRSWGTT